MHCEVVWFQRLLLVAVKPTTVVQVGSFFLFFLPFGQKNKKCPNKHITLCSLGHKLQILGQICLRDCLEATVSSEPQF